MQEELLPAKGATSEMTHVAQPPVRSEMTPVAHPPVRSGSPASDGGAPICPVKEQGEAGEQLAKRKARAKQNDNGRNKQQKKETSQAQPGKRATELSQANKAAAAALTSCFGKSPFAKSSWQNAS